MNKVPFISIITICHNSSLFIEDCINSVINQDYNNYEYIIIDGGSNDGTVDIIKKYQHYLSYWHTKEDRGLSHAFNIGLGHASGEWVAFLNSDDYYNDSKVLSYMAQILEKLNDYDVVYGMINIIDRDNHKKIINKNVGSTFDWNQFRKISTIPHPASFTNKKLFDEVGVYDENYRNALDYELFLRRGKKIKAMYIPVLIAVMRDNGISKSSAVRSLRESKNAIIKNQSLPIYIAYINYYFNLMRLIINKLLKK